MAQRTQGITVHNFRIPLQPKSFQIDFSQKHVSSYRLNTLGPLCLWQCFISVMATHGYFKIWKALKGYPCLFSWLQSSLCWRRWWFWWRWCWWFWCRRKLLDPRSTVNCGGSLPQVGVAMFTFLNEAMFFTMQCFPILNDVIFRRCLKKNIDLNVFDDVYWLFKIFFYQKHR